METSRIRKLQHPRRVHSLLESLSYRDDLVPAQAHRITELQRLPEQLRLLAHRKQHTETAWLAWADGNRIWFFTASPSLALSRERKKPVLSVRLYDEHGALIEASHWVLTHAAGWQKCD